MKSIIQKLWLLVTMLCAATSASTYDFEVDGMYYKVTSLTDMTCEVAKGDNKYEGDVEIPSEVSYNNHKLSVTGIGYEAFRGCTSLSSIEIPNSVTAIGDYAFYYCTSLESITIPNSVTKIGEYAFYWSSLETVIIPNSLAYINSYAFGSCSSLHHVYIPNSVTRINRYAFSGCTSLESITIPNSVTTIGHNAFQYCDALKKIILSDALKKIEYGLFYGCSELECLEIPGSVAMISQHRSGSSYVTFSGCDNLKRFSILYSPEVLAVGFTNYNGYEEFTMFRWEDWTNTIKELYIDREINENIPVVNLETLILGKSVKSVQVQDIKKLNYLTTIKSLALVPPTLSEMTNAQYMNMNVVVPDEAIEEYRSHPVWGKFWNLQQSSGISEISSASEKTITGRFDLSGTPVDENFKGLMVVRFSDGTAKKVFQK
ncbi:MAG: leucine-rich repeat domain-containing protein [Muribaculaceae bacterium]|nr:leucine-rich repeat domain-containing protein [Muribaculaceae bacterium]